jgi:DNA-binding CsgD family transcriptional regulator
MRHLIGRDRELDVLRGLVSGVTTGIGGAVLVSGEPGIGKTALLREGLTGAAGCRVGWGLADELGQQFPLRLMMEWLGEEGQLAVAGGTPGRPDSGLSGWMLSGDPVLAGAERLLTLVDRLCAAGPLVLVAEDLQWADESSLLVWEKLARAAAQLPLLIAGSFRPVPERDALRRMTLSMAARGGTVLELPALPPADVSMLASGLAGGRRLGGRLAGVVGRAGGNPLYVGELVDALARAGRIAVTGGEAELAGGPDGMTVPVSLAAAISRRLDGLAPGVVEVLRWAAMLGAEFSVTDLAVVSGRVAGKLADPLEAALRAGVLAEAGPRLGFRHGLIRQVLYEQVPEAERGALHVRAAAMLADAGAPAERTAMQLIAAPGEARGDWAVEWLAGAGALSYRAPGVAADLLRQVIGQLAEGDVRREVLEAALVRVAFLLAADQELEQVAGGMLARAADPDRAAEVAWLLAYALARNGRQPEAVTVAQAALARPGISETWQARLGARQAMTVAQLGQLKRAAETAEQALAAGKRVGDRFAVGYALYMLALVAFHQREFGLMLGRLEQALAAIGDDPQTTDLRLMLLSHRATALKSVDSYADAGAAIRAALLLGEQVATPRLGTIYCTAADFYFELGQWDDALAMLEPAAGLPGADHRPVLVHGLTALIAGHRDDWDRAGEHLAAVADLPLTLAHHRAIATYLFLARALAAERAGRPGQAVAVLAQCLDPGAAEAIPGRYVLWPALARLALAAGDAATLTQTAQAAAEEAKRLPLPSRVAIAGICQGLLAGDPAPVLAAASSYEAAGRPFDQAGALEDGALLLAGRGDRPGAQRAFADATRLYRGLGAGWDLRRADARLGGYGLRRGRGSRKARPALGWAALTPTEVTIARLVAAGRSNPDIAAELFLSRNTVQTHVSHILAKLEARSRAEIIRQVLQHHPAEPRDQ